MIPLRIDVTGSTALPGRLEIAASLFLPEVVAAPAVAIFAFPGGGYARGYFDMSFPGHDEYSQAAFHTGRGMIFVALDSLGVGDSTIPDFSVLTLEMIAAANAAAVAQIARGLTDGTLVPDLPPLPRLVRIGIGQSLGGCFTILMQGRHAPYDAIAPLGYSAIHTVLPQPTEAARQAAEAVFDRGRDSDPAMLSVEETSRHITDYRYPFHWEDVPADIVAADIGAGFPIRRAPVPPFASPTVPPCAVTAMVPGAVAPEAAAITVPVLMAMGERDVCPDPLAEPSAFKSSRDVSAYVVPAMAHMHNFAGTRHLLWRRLDRWIEMVAENTPRPNGERERPASAGG